MLSQFHLCFEINGTLPLSVDQYLTLCKHSSKCMHIFNHISKRARTSNNDILLIIDIISYCMSMRSLRELTCPLPFLIIKKKSFPWQHGPYIYCRVLLWSNFQHFYDTTCNMYAFTSTIFFLHSIQHPITQYTQPTITCIGQKDMQKALAKQHFLLT